jgi:hypothetical protein
MSLASRQPWLVVLWSRCARVQMAQCPHVNGPWAYFDDADGVQGTASCVRYFPSSSSGVRSWNDAQSQCASAAGSGRQAHLLTSQQGNRPSKGGSDLLSFAGSSGPDNGESDGYFFLGASTTTPGSTPANWRWVRCIPCCLRVLSRLLWHHDGALWLCR